MSNHNRHAIVRRIRTLNRWLQEFDRQYARAVACGTTLEPWYHNKEEEWMHERDELIVELERIDNADVHAIP